MTIDPKTTVGKLIAALPSAALVLQSYGISPQRVVEKPLGEVLMDAHVDAQEFSHALDEIDWSAEVLVKPE